MTKEKELWTISKSAYSIETSPPVAILMTPLRTARLARGFSPRQMLSLTRLTAVRRSIHSARHFQQLHITSTTLKRTTRNKITIITRLLQQKSMQALHTSRSMNSTRLRRPSSHSIRQRTPSLSSPHSAAPTGSQCSRKA